MALNVGPADFDVVLTDAATAQDITDVEALANIDQVNGAGITSITGTAAEVAAAHALLDTAPTTFDAVLTGAATAAEINTVNGLGGLDEIDGSDITSMTGDIAGVIAAYGQMDTKPDAYTVTVNDAFDPGDDYTTFNAAALGADSVTLDDTDNVVSIDLTDAGVVAGDAGDTTFAANDDITVQDAIDGSEFVLGSLTDANMGGNSITLDDNDDNAYTMVSANFNQEFVTNGVLSTAGDTITVNGTANADVINGAGQAANLLLNGLG